MVDLLKGISAAEMGQKIRTQALKVAMIRSDHLTLDTGVTPSLTENQLEEYVDTVLREEAGVLENMDEIIKKEKEILSNSVEYSFCSRDAVLELAYGKYFDIFEEVMERKRQGRHIGIQCVTYINQENIALVRKFYDLGVQIRHVRNLPPIDFAFSDKEMIATIDKSKDGSTIKNLLISNEPAYLQHFKSFFEQLWNSGIDSETRMKSITEGLDSEGIEIIQDPQKVQEIANRLVKSANEEILTIFSTNNAFHRQKKAGSFVLLERAASLGTKVRILTPFDNEIATIAARTNEQYVQADGGRNYQIKPIEPSLQTKVSILVTDKKYSLTVELRDDSQTSSSQAMGLATFSNSKATVLSYVSTFESLWKLSELYEKLKVQDKLQKEFINIAAHELRTPIQPIIGLSQVLELDVNDEERHLITSTIVRNANRLQRLTENLLDVAKIEAQALQLKLERFNIGQMITNIVTDFSKQENGNGKVRILYYVQDLIVCADKDKISQVIHNLVSNALKFTDLGSINLRLTEQDGEFIVVEVQDTGRGINPDVLPNLFTKFVTKSDKGTGLGLYISKGIVEAHGGKIWAENNSARHFKEKGARFCFSLPKDTNNCR
jgi:signal transduction histidine kinase